MTHADFLRAIAANPHYTAPRLTFADWLEERGHEDVARAEYIKLAVELAGATGCGNCVDPSEGYYCFRCEMLRSRLDALLTPERRRVWTMRGLPEDVFHEFPPNRVYVRRNESSDAYLELDFNRGCIEIVTCRWEEWQRHHRAICAVHPVRKVRLTTRPSEHFLWRGYSGYFRDANFDYWNDVRIKSKLAAEIPGADPDNPIEYELVQQDCNSEPTTWNISVSTNGVNWELLGRGRLQPDQWCPEDEG